MAARRKIEESLGLPRKRGLGAKRADSRDAARLLCWYGATARTTIAAETAQLWGSLTQQSVTPATEYGPQVEVPALRDAETLEDALAALIDYFIASERDEYGMVPAANTTRVAFLVNERRALIIFKGLRYRYDLTKDWLKEFETIERELASGEKRAEREQAFSAALAKKTFFNASRVSVTREFDQSMIADIAEPFRSPAAMGGSARATSP